MSEQENKALNEEFFRRVFNEHDLSAIDELLTEDFVEHVEFPGFSQDREGAKVFFAAMFGAFPDMHAEIHEMVASGDRVGIRSTFHGTHQGEFLGVPATGREVSIGAHDIVRVVDGKATDHWGVLDLMGMLQQMGVVPTPSEESAPA